ncbi:MAG: hypothetical protein N3I35_06470 [Clostridia bacterium]|nr:hypothetical protein [Clostridia bacterium]
MNTSIWSVLFVTVPEQALMLITCLLVAGYKDVFSLRVEKNIVKLLGTVILMVISSILCLRFIDNSNTTKSIALGIMFLMIIYTVFRYSFFKCLGGLLVSSIIVIIGEAISYSIILSILNITSIDVYNFSTFSMVLISSPTRILQLVFLYFLLHSKKIKIEINKPSKNEIVLLSFCIAIIIMNMYQIEHFITISRTKEDTLLMFMNAICTTGFSLFCLMKLTSMEKKMVYQHLMHDFDLHRIKQLIEEGRTDYAAELIDLTLKAQNSTNYD